MRPGHYLMLLLAAVTVALGPVSCTDAGPAPVNVIFDTDMGNDIDDAMALDMLYKYADHGRVNLLAVMTSKEGAEPAAFIDIMNTWYGHEVPIGRIRNGTPCEGGAVNFAKVIVEAADTTVNPPVPLFKRSGLDVETLPEPQDLYRKILSRMPDKSVHIISVGFSTNLSRLLESGPDMFSPLTGRELVERKVACLVTMGGRFTEGERHEFNVVTDIASARNVFENWPSPLVTSPFEVGVSICYPGTSMENDFDWGRPHPMALGYLAYCPMPHDRPCWDLTATLYAVEGDGWFSLSDPGRIEIDGTGATTFVPDPSGNSRYLMADPAQCEAVRRHLVELLTTKPESANE